jgi:biopolymer transport protein ExbD
VATELPEVVVGPLIEELEIDDEGQVHIGGTTIGLDVLKDVLLALDHRGVALQLLLRVRPGVKDERIAEVIDVCKKAGVKEVKVVAAANEETSGPPMGKGDRVANKLPIAMPRRVAVSLDAEGRISVDGKRVTLEELPAALSPETGPPTSVHLTITAHSKVAQKRIAELLTKCAEARIEILSVRIHPTARHEGFAAPEH